MSKVPPLSPDARHLAVAHGARVYGAFVVLRSAAHGGLPDDLAVAIAKGRLKSRGSYGPDYSAIPSWNPCTQTFDT